MTCAFLQHGCLQHSRSIMTKVLPSPISLAMMAPGTPAGGLALAWQVKVVLSAVLRGSKVRVLENDCLEPEIVTLAYLLDNSVLLLSQVTSVSVIATSILVAGLMEMEQVSVRGAMLPANSGAGGAVMTTSGVETTMEDNRGWYYFRHQIVPWYNNIANM